MKKLQPNKKSFEYYAYLGYRFANKKNLTPSEKKLFRNLSAIDDSILIIDDIMDKSKLRNGRPCLYLQLGEEKAIIRSKLLEIEARENLLNLAASLKTKEGFKVKIIRKFDAFLKDIYLGEQIDRFLAEYGKVDSVLIKEYFKMISLFTGGHVKYSMEIGQLLANKNPDPLISGSAVSAGIIRQIVDDFNDYFDKHHEPMGDFLSGSNRLPEILFKKFGGNRKTAIKLLHQGRIDDFIKLVLNSKVRAKIVQYCDKEYKVIDKNRHAGLMPIDDYKHIRIV